MKTSVGPKGIASAICGWMVLSVTVAAANDRVYFFHNDHLGTPQAMTDLAGRTVWTAEYEPFGKALVDQDPDGDGLQVINNLRFPGQYYDAESGLHYNYHRDYDPETGRYLQADPVGQAGGLNLYSYVLGNPVRFTDSLGLVPNPAEAACIGGPNPICLSGVAVDIGSGILGGAIIGAILGLPGDIAIEDHSDIVDRTYAPQFPGIRNLEKDCSLGKRVVFLILKGTHKGRTNIEQEYQCGCGLVTRHMIVTPSGQVVHDHFRPGPAKGSVND